MQRIFFDEKMFADEYNDYESNRLFLEVSNTKKKLLAIVLIVLMVMSMVMSMEATVLALDDDEFNGYSADSLIIKVGYFGGPYYEKKIFTVNDLWAMDVVYQDYTFIDNMPSVVINHVAGVRLSDIMSAAGIDVNSIQNFYFWTRDKQSDYYTSYTKSALIDTPRYCYYSMPDNFDNETGTGNELATSDGVSVDTVIALADDWNRCIQGATFGSDYMNLNTNTRFRLIFGQTNAWERTANRSAKWIHEIVVELGGAPVITLEDYNLNGEVGSVLRTNAHIQADSAVMANEKITWTSSDESIASVDDEGNITVHANGAVTITAEFAGVTASLTVNEDNSGGTVGNNKDHENLSSNQSTLGEDSDLQNTEEPELAEIKDAKVDTDTEEGGVQNWRVFEMSENAEALPEIQDDGYILAVTGGTVGGLLAVSGTGYALMFYMNVRGKDKYVYRKND